MRFQRHLMWVILGGVLLMAAAAGEKNWRVAVLDPDRLQRESTSLSAELSKISAPARELVATIQMKQAALSKGLEEFNRQRAALSEEALRQKSEQLQKQAREVQELSRQLQERMDKAGTEGLSPMRQRVGKAVAELARQRGIQLVLTSNSVIYHTDDLDLTSDVVAKLDGETKTN